MKPRQHRIALRIGGRTVDSWTRYSFTSSMLSIADSFSLELGPVTRDLWLLCSPDADVQVLLDDTVIMTGFIDTRDESGQGIAVAGRDKGGRLADESAPLVSYVDLGIKDLARKIADPWFTEVVLENATNRRLLRGRGASLARVSSEPAIDQSRRARKKVEPGERRADVLQAFLEEAGLLAWSSADGKTIIVGKPNYSQEPQFRFFVGKPGSLRAREVNVLSHNLVDSVTERYSQITACGAGSGDGANYSERVTKRRFTVKNGAGAGGTGRDFLHPKRLIVSDDDVRDVKLAEERALREMAQRDASGREVRLVVAGHAQEREAGAAPALYTFDTMCTYEDELLDLKLDMLIVGATFSGDRSKETTELRLVPKGTTLRL